MKKNLLLFVFTLSSIVAFAQQDTTTVYSRPGYSIDPLRANWTRKVEQKDSLWTLLMYDQKNVLREKVNFANQKLEVRKGPYVFYENGNVKNEGLYEKGYKIGEWIDYYPNKQVAEKATYRWDLLSGPYIAYWTNGAVKREGNYRKGKKDGAWKLYYSNGKTAYEENYENGRLLSGQYFDQEGNAIKPATLIQLPAYADGELAFAKYVGRAIKYPKKALENKVEGIVVVAFTIKKDGSIEDLEIEKSPSPELSKEAVRLLTHGKAWQPGKELGETVDSRIAVPVTFSIAK